MLRGMVDAQPTRAQNSPIVLLITGCGAIVLAALGWMFWQLQTELQHLDARLVKVESAARAELGPLHEKLALLDAHLTEISKTTAPPDTQALTDKLQEIAAAQTQLRDDMQQLRSSNQDTRSANQQLSITNLRRAVASGHEFNAELLQLDPQWADAANPLRAWATTGIPTRTQLADELEVLAPNLLNVPDDKNFWHAAWQHLQDWITTKPLPSANANIATMAGKISRALYDIAQDQVDTALAVLPIDDARLTGFRAQAENYITAQQTLRKLEALQPAPPPAGAATP